MRELWHRHSKEYEHPAHPILPVNRHKVHDALVEAAVTHDLGAKATRHSPTKFTVGTPGHDGFRHVVDFSAGTSFSKDSLLCTCRLPLVEGRPCVHVGGTARVSGKHDAVNFYQTVDTARAMYAAVSAAPTPDATSFDHQQASWPDSDLKLPAWVKKKQVLRAEAKGAGQAFRGRTSSRTGPSTVVRRPNRGRDQLGGAPSRTRPL